MFVDSHCHLNFPDLANQLPTLLQNMVDNQVTHALCIGINLPHLHEVIALAENHPNLYATVGIHPDEEDTPEATLNELVTLAQHPKVVAIGETGLDYYRLNGRTIDQMEWQRERFRNHIRAAKLTKKPLVIHTRSSAEDTLRVMQEEGADEVGGVMHCFTENWDIAKAALDMNFHISISGIVTFKNALEVQNTAKNVPLNRLLIETDSPYLAPIPFRGKQNQPAYVRHTGEYLAQLRGEPLEHFARATSQNFFKLFDIPMPDFYA